MGCVNSITYDTFPKQHEKFLNKRVKVCFHYDTSKFIRGYIVRYDIDAPFKTIIKLDDGRYVLGTECQFSLVPFEDYVAELDEDIKKILENYIAIGEKYEVEEETITEILKKLQEGEE